MRASSVTAVFAISGKACSLALLLSVAFSGHALQLGKHRGAAIVGQPLNITIQAVVDSPDEVAPGCVEADVFYADNRVEKSRVRITTEKGGVGSQDLNIRIRTTLAIDEPVVTIYLRTGCLQKVEKRYVVLADMVSESASAATSTVPVLPAPLRSPAAGSTAESAAPKVSRAPSARETRRIERQAQRAEQKAASPPAAEGAVPGKQRTAASLKPAAPEKSAARLKLEPLDLLAERSPALRSSVELLTAPSSDPGQRAAAAALWRAIAAQPEDILGDAQKLKSLEVAVSGLQSQMKKNQLDMQDLDGNIKKAQSEKFANPLIYGLVAALLLAVLGLFLLLKKRIAAANQGSEAEPWWRKGSGQRVGWADSAEAIRSSVSPASLAPESDDGQHDEGDHPAGASSLDLDLSDSARKPTRNDARTSRAEASFLTPQGSQSPSGDANEPTVNMRPGFLPSSGLTGRSVKAEELFDVQQQADFFVSLGQKDQAIEVLRMHIEEADKTSALVYLDLLKLYHEQGEQLEFEAFRQEFNAKFNAEMPAFDGYRDAAAGEGLQAYPIAMSRIVALWPSAKVLTVLEESMFREPDSQTATFDLEAYRELLLLYAMMKDMLHLQSLHKGPTIAFAPHTGGNKPLTLISSKAGGEHPGTTSHFPSTAVVPLAASSNSGGLTVDVELDVDVDFQTSLDVDLTGLGPSSARLEDSGYPRSAESAAGSEHLRDVPRTAPLKFAAPEASTLENSIDFDFDVPASRKPTVKKPGRWPGKKT